jgi:hypothetical protein
LFFYPNGSSAYPYLSVLTLANVDLLSTVVSARNLVKMTLTPFFFQDRQHVFYVTTEKSWVPIEKVSDFGRGLPDSFRDLSGLFERKLTVRPDLRFPPEEDPRLASIGYSGGKFGPEIDRMLQRIELAHIEILLPNMTTIVFGDRIIGPAGSNPITSIR